MVRRTAEKAVAHARPRLQRLAAGDLLDHRGDLALLVERLGEARHGIGQPHNREIIVSDVTDLVRENTRQLALVANQSECTARDVHEAARGRERVDAIGVEHDERPRQTRAIGRLGQRRAHERDVLVEGRVLNDTKAPADLETDVLADLAFLRNTSIDLIVSVFALTAVDDLDRVLRQAHRVLQTSAPFIVSLPHPLSTLIQQASDGSLRMARRFRDHTPLGEGASLSYPHQIGELAEMFGITLRTIRFYEERGLLAPRRVSARTRLYDVADVARLSLIVACRRFGLTVDEVAATTLDGLEQQGVVFLSTDQALKDHPELFKQYFGTVIPTGDNKFSALNTAVWSGGSFIYVPPGVNVEIPLQAYFRINTENMGQFERTLIIVDEGAYVHYVEGCTAPIYKSDSLHSAVVEIIVKKNARCRYTTIQNWSTNVYNLVTKRAVAHEGATMEWVDGNLGSKVTMKYPSIYLLGKGARGEVLSVAYAGEGMHTDAGGKAIHAAPYTTSVITSKSVSKGGGRTGYRGLVRVEPDAHHAKSTVKCDALILDDASRSDTYPYIEVEDETASLGHEATVSRVSEEQLFYLMSRGVATEEARRLVVRGFFHEVLQQVGIDHLEARLVARVDAQLKGHGA